MMSDADKLDIAVKRIDDLEKLLASTLTVLDDHLQIARQNTESIINLNTAIKVLKDVINESTVNKTIPSVVFNNSTVPQSKDIKATYKYSELFTGPNSLFVKHFFPSIITGGQGYIRHGHFTQYEDDVLYSSFSRLKDYPTGFYRNKNTKDIQVLLNLDTVIVCVEGMPTVNLNIQIYCKNGFVRERLTGAVGTGELMYEPCELVESDLLILSKAIEDKLLLY